MINSKRIQKGMESSTWGIAKTGNKLVCSLPERIRPSVLAFGGVADGFVPFDAHTLDGQAGESQEVELQMASIVMKAVQVCKLDTSD